MSLNEMGNILVAKLRRVTSSREFIPEIDGLRFLAILAVVLFHTNALIVREGSFIFTDKINFYNLARIFFENGFKGVELFFVISGFIIALPFVKHFLNKEKKVEIKNYFVRRLTRIEPPYIVSIVVHFFYLAYMGAYTATKLWPSLLSALFYFNNNFNFGVPLNRVAWSLEIEIQFYIVAPLFCYIFVLNKIIRRALLMVLIISLPFIQAMYLPHFMTVYNYLQYFFVGILLADLYVSKFKITLSKILSVTVGVLLFFFMFYVDIARSFGQLLFVLSILVFYFLALNDEFWKKVFSIKYITIIGGMCYSIYLWHAVILMPEINKIIFVKISNDYLITFISQCFIILPCILIISTFFYLLVERPCMDKNWPKDLINFFKNKMNADQKIIKI